MLSNTILTVSRGKLLNSGPCRHCVRKILSSKLHTSFYLRKAVPSNLKGKSKSSQEWLTRQLNDPYVKKAQELNFRARSAFKLIEIDDKVKILKPGQIVVECGAAPGAWSQVIVQRINSTGKETRKRIGTVIGIDLLPIVPLNGAIFLSGSDFTSSTTRAKIQELLLESCAKRVGRWDSKEQGHPDQNGSLGKNFADTRIGSQPDVVLSDMAPNATGHGGTDHERIMKLVESALQFALENGKTGGHFLTKVWDGNEIKKLENGLATYYEKVSRHKPPSSRNDSSEIFLLGRFKK